MKKAALLLAFVLAFASVSLPPQASAAESKEDIWTMAQSDQYGKKFGGMLGRGLVNAATCFVDLVVQTVNGTKEGPAFIGTLTGLGGGLGCTALRATSGVLDIATSWVPGFNGIPVSKSYDNCLEFEEEAPAQEEVAPAVAAPVRQPVLEEQPAPSRNVMEYVKK